MKDTARASMHAALGDVARLRMVDALRLGDHTFQELAQIAGLTGNLAAYHLDVLEHVGIVGRHASEGDRRRRYISLVADPIQALAAVAPTPLGSVAFICTHNSARSQFAAAFWGQHVGNRVASAGTAPAARVHPDAVRAATAFELDLGTAVPRHISELEEEPDLVVTVCDRARETQLPFKAASLHWSIPDPVRAGRPEAFERAFATIAMRIARLAALPTKPT